jgi:hypothetical protein
VGLNHHPLNHQSNAITTTPTTEMLIKSRRDRVDSAYLHIVMVIAQREQNRFNYISVGIYDCESGFEPTSIELPIWIYNNSSFNVSFP